MLKYLPTSIAVFAILIACAAPAYAQDAMDDAPAEAASQPFQHPADDVSYGKDLRDDAAPPVSSPLYDGKVSAISGGVSDSGMSAMEAEKAAYDLQLLFVAGAEYLADVRVAITDNKGETALNTVAEGPVLLARMPSGRYTLVATADDGATVSRTIDVAKNHLVSYTLRYPSRE